MWAVGLVAEVGGRAAVKIFLLGRYPPRLQPWVSRPITAFPAHVQSPKGPIFRSTACALLCGETILLPGTCFGRGPPSPRFFGLALGG